MKRKERKALGMIQQVLSGVRLPAGGTQSTTIAGLSGYAKDMRLVLPGIMRVISTMGGGESYSGELTDDVAYLQQLFEQTGN
jgi:hypothetical protein